MIDMTLDIIMIESLCRFCYYFVMSVLYIVATPIGNLKDITLRALETLKEVDLIVAEDTRVTSRLLQAYEIVKPMMAYHQHSENEEKIIKLLKSGKNVALVSDAGTPGVNDPGGKLVEAVLKTGLDITIVPIPGASAIMSILSVAGIPLETFLYKGFIPHKKGRETFIKEIGEIDYPVVFFESVHRIEKMLEQMEKFFPANKRLILGREMTKIFETVYRGSVEEVMEQLKPDQIKGEFVVLVHNERK